MQKHNCNVRHLETTRHCGTLGPWNENGEDQTASSNNTSASKKTKMKSRRRLQARWQLYMASSMCTAVVLTGNTLMMMHSGAGR